MRNAARLLLLALCLSLSSGCAVARTAIAMTRSVDRFAPLAADPRVRVESGAESNGEILARALPGAIATVERQQLRAFDRPVTIYVCARTETARRMGGSSGRPAGFVLNRRLFITAKPENTPERLPRVLAHELSHLQLEQQIGFWKAGRLPAWFKEGLATYVSGGGGAEDVTDAEARAALLEGRSFRPDARRGVLGQKTARDFGLPAHLFYREASLFLAFLHDLDPASWTRFLLAVEDGQGLESACRRAWGIGFEEQWAAFLVSLRDPQALPTR